MHEIVFSSSDKAQNKGISKLEKSGVIRKIAPRIYTSNLEESPEIIIRRNLFLILGKLYPGCLLSHRSALEFRPTKTNQIFITYTYNKNIQLPGITLRFLEGPGPLEGDNPITDGLFVSQQGRALLENLQVSRKLGTDSKILTLPEIEAKLDQIARVHGDEGLNLLRDKSRQISMQLGMEQEFDKLNKLISAMLSTHPSKILKSPLAMARAFGLPYDPIRLPIFESLFVALKTSEFTLISDKNIGLESFRNFAFFEAYFSNYIEGTEFEIEEAKNIIESGLPMVNRGEDSHDILGTYQLLCNKLEMSITPNDPEDLFEILRYRHSILLQARKSKNPGQFKDKNNRAGNTEFVDYKLVKGTLSKGFDFYKALEHPFSKAAYIMFLISEVHPFLDGNGRIARVMMNSELLKNGQQKIIIPTVFREDYMGALRKLTRMSEPEPYIRMLSKAWEFSSTIYGADMNIMQFNLERSNAFLEPEQGKLKIIK